VKCWGADSEGELGDGSVNYSATPDPQTVSGLSGATALAVGYEDACAIVSKGDVVCWGYGYDGELGNGSDSETAFPVKVAGISGVKAVSVGESTVCARLSNGTLDCWGSNFYGEAGGGYFGFSGSPVPVSGLKL
jgi:alpha-tubulin suppressor-like RCC1 family protein